MKFVLLLLLCSPVFSQSIQDRVKGFEEGKKYTVKEDKFRKETKVDYAAQIPSSKESPKQGYLGVSFSCVLPESGDPQFYWWADYGDLLSRDALRILADGELLELPQESSAGYSAIYVPTDEQLAKLGKAKIIEVQLRRFEGRLNAKMVTALHNIIGFTKW